MPYGRGYGGTKRRASAMLYGRTKRRRVTPRPLYRRIKKRTGYRKRRVAPLYRPVKVGHGQPVTILAKHTFNTVQAAAILAGVHEVNAAIFSPMQGNNVLNGTAGTRAYPMNWTDYSRMYSNVRVHGIKITAYFDDLDAGANDCFTSCWYSLPGPKDGSTPSAVDPYGVTTDLQASLFLQEKQIRKKKFIGSGANKPNGNTHASGYWSVKRIQSELALDANVTELVVNSDGSAADSPDVIPQVVHKLLATRSGGVGTNVAFSIRYQVTLYCQWYARRRVFETSFTEV